MLLVLLLKPPFPSLSNNHTPHSPTDLLLDALQGDEVRHPDALLPEVPDALGGGGLAVRDDGVHEPPARHGHGGGELASGRAVGWTVGGGRVGGGG